MITVALVGNPNAGKTTLFNSLTNLNEYVGNWAGVTVDKKEGFINPSIKIVDLPGIYALDTYSNEEKITRSFLESNTYDLIINIVDATNLARNLYLTTQLKQYNKPIILLLNKTDELENNGLSINYSILSEKLDITTLPIVASKNIGLNTLKELLNSGDFLTNSIDKHYQLLHEKETYEFIDNILNSCLIKTNSNSTIFTEKMDKIILNKYFAYPIFILAMLLIFQFTFSWVGMPLANLLSEGLENALIPFVENLLSSSSDWFKSLIINGIIGGVGSVLVFLPVILALFFGISILEESGYMARAAFITDKTMRRMGLSGKAFIPLVVGFGCTVPAIMTARTLESEKDRKLTALLVPLMSCNARLPVYALFAAAFFPSHGALVAGSLYAMGVIFAFLMGMLFKNTIFKKQEEPFLIELPKYSIPSLKSLISNTWDKGKGFLKKAGTIIFSISVLIWLLANFNFQGLTHIQNSFLSYIGTFISPIFKPLGFGSWENSVALLAGLSAKEVIIDTLGVIYGGNLVSALPNYFTEVSAYSFLVFVLLYTPCISVIVTMKKEYGNKLTLFSIFYQLTLAWCSSFLVYNIGNLIVRFF